MTKYIQKSPLNILNFTEPVLPLILIGRPKGKGTTDEKAEIAPYTVWTAMSGKVTVIKTSSCSMN